MTTLPQMSDGVSHPSHEPDAGGHFGIFGGRHVPEALRAYVGLDTDAPAYAPGEYTLRTLSDDGVRVWVDGVLVIDDWKPHETALDFAPLAGGHHDLRVQYYQADGWYELRVDIVRGGERSPGSPGQHGAD